MRKIALVFALSLSVPAYAGTIQTLVRSWYENGRLHCQYSNGTILAGMLMCPPSIQGN